MTSPLLVLGGSGQMGGALLREAGRRGAAAVGTHRGHPQENLMLWDADDPLNDRILDRLKPAAVAYAIGLTNVDACENRRAEAERWNAEVPSRIAKACLGRFPFVYFSTDYVFNGTAGPYREEDPISPISVYGWSKAHGETGVLSADSKALVIRTTGLFGPEAQQKNFVAQLRRRLSTGERVRVPTDQISTPTYNEDLAARTLDLLALGATGIWNVAGPERMSRMALARSATAVFGLNPALLEPVSTAQLNQAARRPLSGGLRIDKLIRAFPPAPMRTPRQALEAYAALSPTA